MIINMIGFQPRFNLHTSYSNQKHLPGEPKDAFYRRVISLFYQSSENEISRHLVDPVIKFLIII